MAERGDDVRAALLEVYKRWRNGYAYNDDSEEDVDLASRAALATPPAASPDRAVAAREGGQEPVAWMVRYPAGAGCWGLTFDPRGRGAGWEIKALVFAEANAACEQMRRERD